MSNEPAKQAVNRDENGRFLPGSTGNRNGRPRNELSLTNLAREKLGEPCPYAPDKTWAQYLVDRWLGQAVENVTYFRELIERIEGKVLQPIGGQDGEPIKYEISVKDAETKQLTDRLIAGGSVVSHINLS